MGDGRYDPTRFDANQSLLLSYTHLDWRVPPLVKYDLAKNIFYTQAKLSINWFLGGKNK